MLKVTYFNTNDSFDTFWDANIQYIQIFNILYILNVNAKIQIFRFSRCFQWVNHKKNSITITKKWSKKSIIPNILLFVLWIISTVTFVQFLLLNTVSINNNFKVIFFGQGIKCFTLITISLYLSSQMTIEGYYTIAYVLL